MFFSCVGLPTKDFMIML